MLSGRHWWHKVQSYVLVLSSTFVIVILAVQMVMAPSRLAPSTDERNHQQRMQSWFHHGYYLPRRFLVDGVPVEDLEPGRIHAYGPAWSLSAHALNVARGFETWGNISTKPLPMAMRNHMSVILGLAASMAVGYAITLATAAWPIGVWAAAAVLAIPAWTGYSMFHPKDVSVGAGYTMLTSGLVAALASPNHRHQVAAAVLFAVGIFYGVGTRTAMWLPFAATTLIFVALAWYNGKRCFTVLIGGVVGVGSVVAINYRHVANFHDWFIGSLGISHSFPVERWSLTAGEVLSSLNTPWWYLPLWFGTTVPLGILAVATLGVLLLFQRPEWDWSLRDRLAGRDAGLVLFAAQAFGLTTMAIASGATVYGGLRQHLYALPALAALAGLGAALLMKYRPSWLVTITLALILLIPTAEQSLLFPYNSSYRNILAHPMEGRWESDMHRISFLEAMSIAPRGEYPVCREPQKSGKCWLRVRSDYPHLGIVPDNCHIHDAVTRRLRWETLRMTRIAICEFSDTSPPQADPATQGDGIPLDDD